jgi:hypothetical protein
MDFQRTVSGVSLIDCPGLMDGEWIVRLVIFDDRLLFHAASKKGATGSLPADRHYV